MSDESARGRTLLPFPQQLDTEGRLHDIGPEHKGVRLFEPAPEQLPGQASIELDGDA
jgi:hypothetical protein